MYYLFNYWGSEKPPQKSDSQILIPMLKQTQVLCKTTKELSHHFHTSFYLQTLENRRVLYLRGVSFHLNTRPGGTAGRGCQSPEWIYHVWNLPDLWMEPVNSFDWLEQLELGFLLHITESILTDRPCRGRRQCPARIPWISFSIPPTFCAPFFFQWPVPLTLFTGLLELVCFFTQRTKSEHTSSPGQAFANHLPVDKHEAQHPRPERPCGIFYTLGPPCGICTFAGFLPFHIQHMQLTSSFSRKHFLTNDLSTNPHLGSSLGEPS